MFFLEACFLISVFHKASSPVQLWDQKTPTCSVLAVLTAEALRNADYCHCFLFPLFLSSEMLRRVRSSGILRFLRPQLL